MAKRGATRELNHDNWDDEEDEEDAGQFVQAPKEVIQQRTVKTAKRRLDPSSGGSESGAASPLAKFQGFTANKTPVVNWGNLVPSTSASAPTPPVPPPMPTSAPISVDDQYESQLRALNRSVTSWIKEHVDREPLCILTPVFQDYDKHLGQIQDKFNKSPSKMFGASTAARVPNGGGSEGDEQMTEGKEKEDKSAGLFSVGEKKTLFGSGSFTGFGKSSTSGTFGGHASTSTFGGSSIPAMFSGGPSPAMFSGGSGGFTLGASTAAIAEEAKKKLEGGEEPKKSFFGPSTSSSIEPIAGTSKPFSFTSGKPFTFSNVTATSKSSQEDEGVGSEAGEDDEPPKPEFKQVVEEDAICSKRCKMFVMLNGGYKERGIGTLYVKSISDGNKVQLVLRADTSLGNVLLNTLLSPAMHIEQKGGKNVLMACPSPVIPGMDKGPATVLLKFKSEEEAKEVVELLKKLNEGGD